MIVHRNLGTANRLIAGSGARPRFRIFPGEAGGVKEGLQRWRVSSPELPLELRGCAEQRHSRVPPTESIAGPDPTRKEGRSALSLAQHRVNPLAAVRTAHAQRVPQRATPNAAIEPVDQSPAATALPHPFEIDNTLC